MINKIYKIVEDACKNDKNYFGYGIWKYHILGVIKYGKLLAEKVESDVEIVELACLLHDYASIINYDFYEDHHIYGMEEAEKILKQFKYPVDRIEKIKDCIYCHRGSKPKEKLSKEVMCVADADGMSHFDYIGSMFYLAFFSHKLDIDEAEIWLKNKLERSWKKLSPVAKEIMQDKYEAIMLILKR